MGFKFNTFVWTNIQYKSRIHLREDIDDWRILIDYIKLLINFNLYR